MIAAVWILTLLCLAVWSLAAWGLQLLLTADPQWIDNLGELARELPFGDWLERWVPGWQALLQLALDHAQSALEWVGSAAPTVVWVAWGAGAAALLFVAVLLNVMVAVLRPKAAHS